LKIRAVCQEKKIGFTTYCIPKQEDIYDWLWQSETKPEPHTDLQSLYDRSKALRLTQAFLDEQKLTSFSVVDMLKTHLNEEPLYFFCDGHCSEYGNRLIAEQIHDYLIQTHFLGIFTAPRPMN